MTTRARGSGPTVSAKLRYKGLFTSSMAPTHRAYCVLFSFFIGVLLLTAGSIFYHLILMRPMSGTHAMHTPPAPLALALLAAGIFAIVASCAVAWRYGLDDGDDSLEDDLIAFAKDDVLEHQFCPPHPRHHIVHNAPQYQHHQSPEHQCQHQHHQQQAPQYHQHHNPQHQKPPGEPGAPEYTSVPHRCSATQHKAPPPQCNAQQCNPPNPPPKQCNVPHHGTTCPQAPNPHHHSHPPTHHATKTVKAFED
ncbi:uncharacterized protein LOC143033350 [Oratosquilla oratoria]|uniref:uncharacterized protein LOC143033350 n=1 Tax=Oratosquilla oratoria TaxID=337810 RepID=UPI003F773650